MYHRNKKYKKRQAPDRVYTNRCSHINSQGRETLNPYGRTLYNTYKEKCEPYKELKQLDINSKSSLYENIIADPNSSLNEISSHLKYLQDCLNARTNFNSECVQTIDKAHEEHQEWLEKYIEKFQQAKVERSIQIVRGFFKQIINNSNFNFKNGFEDSMDFRNASLKIRDVIINLPNHSVDIYEDTQEDEKNNYKNQGEYIMDTMLDNDLSLEKKLSNILETLQENTYLSTFIELTLSQANENIKKYPNLENITDETIKNNLLISNDIVELVYILEENFVSMQIEKNISENISKEFLKFSQEIYQTIIKSEFFVYLNSKPSAVKSSQTDSQFDSQFSQPETQETVKATTPLSKRKSNEGNDKGKKKPRYSAGTRKIKKIKESKVKKSKSKSKKNKKSKKSKKSKR
tara:strand:- start:4844 stop:6058 length:1215 start_codon:yes stop_codon:yes gene_type:complete